MALGSDLAAPRPAGVLAFRVTVRPNANATLVRRFPGLRRTRAQGSLYQDEVFKPFLPREVALHAHAPPPQPDREFPASIPSQTPPSRIIPSPPLARWRRAHFRRVFLRVRPGGRCRCRPTGSSLFAAQTNNGDGVRTVWLELGSSSSAPS